MDGSVFTIPPTSWGKEIRILRVIKNVMVDVVASGIFQRGVDTAGNPIPIDETEATQKLLTLLFGSAPEQLTEAVSALTGKPAVRPPVIVPIPDAAPPPTQ